METYDFLMLLVLATTTLFGFWKGMAWQIASLASLVVSYFAALRFSDQLAPVFGDQAPLNRFAAMLAIYAGVSFIIWMLFRLVSGVIDKVRLESFDKQMGATIGLAKGVLLCVAITIFAVTLLPQPQGEAIIASKSGRYIIALLDKSHAVVPPEIHQVVEPYLQKFEERRRGNFNQTATGLPSVWPSQAQLPTGLPTGLPTAWPQVSWPQPQSQSQPKSQPQSQQTGWPYSSGSQQGSSSQGQSAGQPAERDPYSVPREPNPFPGPYSAEVPVSRDY